MARYRLSRLAEADLKHILSASADRWGRGGARRYAAAIAATFRLAAKAPDVTMNRDRHELLAGLRSLHTRHARPADESVRRPVHVIYYRMSAPGLIEIVRVLHERMEPSRHLHEDAPG